MKKPEKYPLAHLSLAQLPLAHLSRTATWDEQLAGRVRQAAVMVLISEAEAEPSILFTQRARGISQGWQVSFPGGGREGAENPEQTALRETYEEIGLDASEIQIWGRLAAPTASRLRVDPVAVVGCWSGASELLRPNAAEVERILNVPVRELVDPAHRVTWEIEHDHTGPGFLVDNVVIWGMTAGITDAVLEIFGWNQRWDRERMMRVPSEFR
ncbi:MAG: CoA pyrophosphatase [Actinomycetaceae bacterium]|nr:CoA pyrophosphatase [Arcanobacterium sp.]MDD7687068.1 CoA pyrophosphatase [Actinomycetaceae bacterium]MDY5273274.1 CoA pyrophosphatase [Arcanobacterium sp.]